MSVDSENVHNTESHRSSKSSQETVVDENVQNTDSNRSSQSSQESFAGDNRDTTHSQESDVRDHVVHVDEPGVSEKKTDKKEPTCAQTSVQDNKGTLSACASEDGEKFLKFDNTLDGCQFMFKETYQVAEHLKDSILSNPVKIGIPCLTLDHVESYKGVLSGASVAVITDEKKLLCAETNSEYTDSSFMNSLVKFVRNGEGSTSDNLEEALYIGDDGSYLFKPEIAEKACGLIGHLRNQLEDKLVGLD